jgi:hypothetical protein
MTLLNIDRQPEAVRTFFEALSLDEEGSVVEMSGRRLAWVLPAVPGSSEWNEAKNARRCLLIDRDIEGVISADESSELELLQEELQRHVERTAPLPLEFARQLHRQLLAKSQVPAVNGHP